MSNHSLDEIVYQLLSVSPVAVAVESSSLFDHATFGGSEFKCPQERGSFLEVGSASD